jgi:uncharacterized protein with von Willebrand factor type A (vWA) domain
MKTVLDEARIYRQHGIVLNIIMLDDEEFRELAKGLAKENLGRVAFVDPGNLGEALVEDYIVSKREMLRE